MQGMQGTRQHLIVCVLMGAKHEVTIMAAVSLLRMQTMLMSSPTNTDMYFVRDLNEAMHTIYSNAKSDDACALILDGSVGFDVQFVPRALKSGVPLLVGVHPLPVIDWQRVSSRPGGGEDPAHWGNVYNVTPVGSSVDDNGYMEVCGVKSLGLLWLRAGVLRDIAARHPEIVGEGGTAFAVSGVFGGKALQPHERLLTLYGGKVLADPSSAAMCSGPAEFAGCVGARTTLR